jgi:hypothetical protein
MTIDAMEGKASRHSHGTGRPADEGHEPGAVWHRKASQKKAVLFCKKNQKLFIPEFENRFA